MKQPFSVLAELDDWSILSSFFPEGWRQKARECGALTRARGIAGPDALLRILLIHIANGCSLAETSLRAGQLGLGQLNQSTVYKRLRSAEEWLRWMADQMRASLDFTVPKVASAVLGFAKLNNSPAIPVFNTISPRFIQVISFGFLEQNLRTKRTKKVMCFKGVREKLEASLESTACGG